MSLDEMINIYDTLVLGLELPATVNAAINRKVEQYYLVQEYGFRVEREKKESERKQIEANGIRDFQQTVTQGISDSYVRWRGIEATLQLAQSPNTKIVIIGSGKDGLPVILGNVDTPMQPNPAAQAPAPGAAPCPTTAKPPSRSRRPPARRCWKRHRPAICGPAERPSPTAVPRAPSDTPPGPAAGSPPNGAPDMPRRPSSRSARRGAAHIVDLGRTAGTHCANGAVRGPPQDRPRPPAARPMPPSDAASRHDPQPVTAAPAAGSRRHRAGPRSACPRGRQNDKIAAGAVNSGAAAPQQAADRHNTLSWLWIAGWRRSAKSVG